MNNQVNGEVDAC